MLTRPKAEITFAPEAPALDRWDPALALAPEGVSAEGGAIEVFDVIGDGWDGDGVTLKSVRAALTAAGGKPVDVLINSPGGDLFEGFAIHSLLLDYKGEVTVKILGIAASAASIIAMAGARIEIAPAAFLMIHKAWGVVIGNSDELRVIAEDLDKFDDAQARLFAKRSGADQARVAEWLCAETFFSASDAVEHGFADAVMAEPMASRDKKGARALIARRTVEAALRGQGRSRAQRRALIRDIREGTPGAADMDPQGGTPSAASDASEAGAFIAGAARLIEALKS